MRARRVLWIAFLTVILAPSLASAETRTLKLYYVHTKERAEITFKKDGRYIPSGLNQLNRFLRDWRRNEPTKMDPRLFDLVWQVYKASGARDYIHVVSAYRSPATNSMLRSRTRGVAKKSQHMLGKAMDFYIPGVPLAKLRAIGMRYQSGGVGYYPRSGSPFVHMDVGNVRHWPRMSRRELLALFPDGKTLHLPTDGKPLPGYEAALAAYEARQSGSGVMMASASPRKSKSLLAMLFGGGADEEEDISESGGGTMVASAARPTRTAPRAPMAEEAPEPAAPVARAPAPQPQPLPEPPQQTLVAALPPREVPRPLDAPRPAAAVAEGTPVEQPALAYAVPLPGQKPQAAIAMVAPPPNTLQPPAPGTTGYVPSASAVDGAPNAAAAPEQVAAASTPNPLMNGFVPVPMNKPKHENPALALASAVVPAPRPETAPAAAAAEAVVQEPEPRHDAIAQIAAAHADTPAYPLPQSAPERPQPQPQQVALAAPEEEVIPVPDEPEDHAPQIVASVTPAAMPRKVLQDAAPKARAIAAVDTGVKTTAKGAKPHPGEAREPEAVVQPAASVPVSRLAMSATPVAKVAPAGGKALRNDALRAAPTTVYTAGFQRDLPTEKANRFSGKAVTFLSIAKFSETN
ncbi:DUF882 domain-containing protein [Brucella sp. IR073]|uniref:DUF882 domain-containing protein n=1 Tax=unclassified Brucella TaxID=2632610 RepID=UPI003B986844